MQVSLVTSKLHKERANLLKNMRDACLGNRLRFSRDMAIVATIVSTLKDNMRRVALGKKGFITVEELSALALNAAVNYDKVVMSQYPRGSSAGNGQVNAQQGQGGGPVSRLLEEGKAKEVCRNAFLMLSKVNPSGGMACNTDPIRKCYGDWQWSMLLMRYVFKVYE